MARTNNIWVVIIYKDKAKSEYFKTINCDTLNQIAYLLDRKVYDVSNVFHKITKPNGIFEYVTIYKTI
jgi:hypothetical protein